MRRALCIALVFMVLMSFGLVGYCEDNLVQVVVDGTVSEIKPDAKIVNDSTYVEMKSFAESFPFEAKVTAEKSGSTNKYVIDRENIGRTLIIQESKGIINEVTVNGIIKKTNITAIYEQDQIWVPVVFLVEHLGGEATWSQLTQRVMVESYKPIVFNDPNLEAAVRSFVGILEGDIFKCDFELVNILSVPNSQIKDLEGIQYLPNLVHLDLSNNEITDISQLRQLRKLTTVYLKGNQITDYSPLAAIYNQLNLRDFNLKVSIKDKNLDAAIRAHIRKPNGEITLESLQNITELNLDNEKISHLDGIQYVVNLESLSLTGNNIEDIEPLKNLIDLQSLTLNQNQIENIEPICYLKNLEILDLLDNKISDISPLSELFMLKQLSVLNNEVSDISPLKGLVNLEFLVLQDNEISDVSAIQSLVNLEKLYLKNNKISDISMFKYLINLELLDLRNNEISDFSSLEGLKDLKDLLRDTSDGETPEESTTPGMTPSPVPSPTAGSKDTEEQIVQCFYIDKPFYYVNNTKTEMDVAPIISNGRTFLPVRYVAESLGAEVKWNDQERKITVVLGDRTAEMLIDKDIGLVNGEMKPIDAPPFILDGRTLVPLRFLSEALGCKVEWDSDIRCVFIYNEAYVKNHLYNFIEG